VKSFKCSKYIVNCTPTITLEDITIEEVWSKIKPYVIHFHVFVVKHRITFLMRKGNHYIIRVRSVFFFGYSKYVKGYRLLEPHSYEIIIRRGFNFDEGPQD